MMDEKKDQLKTDIKDVKNQLKKTPAKKQFAAMFLCVAIIVPPVTLGIITSFNEPARNTLYEMLGVSKAEQPAQSAPTLKP